jgi:hypothetical protein
VGVGPDRSIQRYEAQRRGTTQRMVILRGGGDELWEFPIDFHSERTSAVKKQGNPISILRARLDALCV